MGSRVRSLLQVNCTDSQCPLWPRSDFTPTEIVRERGEGDIDVMFLGEAPGEIDVKSNRPFLDMAGQFLRKTMAAAMGTKPVNYALTQAVRCLPLDPTGNDRRPTTGELRACRTHVDRDIHDLNPRVIVLLGASALHWATGSTAISSYRGQWWWQDIQGEKRLVLATWHPGVAQRQNSALPLFYEDLRLALRFAHGDQPRASWGHLGRSVLLRTVEKIRWLRDTLLGGVGPYVAVDVETRNLNKQYGNALGMVQFAWEEDRAYCVPLEHRETPWAPQEYAEVVGLLREIFTAPVGFHWVTHFGKFEQTQIGRHILGGKETFRNAPMLDTGSLAYLLDENKTTVPGGYALKSLARNVLDFRHYDDATLAVRAEGNLLDLPLQCEAQIGTPEWYPNLTDYGGMDAYVTLRLLHALKLQAGDYWEQAERLMRLLFGPVARLMSVMERNGFWANLQHLMMLKDPKRSPIIRRLKEIDDEVVPRYESAQRANTRVLRGLHGCDPLFDEPWVLDLQKPDHVRAWLIEECGLEPLSKGKSGKPNADKAFLAHYDHVEEACLVAERRHLSQLTNNFINKMIGYLDPRNNHADCQDGRIRCDFLFTGTATGRASASNPNMHQQVRSDTEEKAAIKDIFQAEQPGVQESFHLSTHRAHKAAEPQRRRCLVQLDFMANECRWWSVMSKCPDLARSLNAGKAARDLYRREPTPENRDAAKIGGDLHRQTASLMFGVDIHDVDKHMRTASKCITFGAMYGRGVMALAQQIKKPREDAERLMDQFSSAFPVGWAYLQNMPRRAQRHWYIESQLGRRRRLPGFMLHSRQMNFNDRKIVAECERKSKNAPIQADASDAAFIGASLFSDFIQDHGKDWYVQNVVHDSCVYELPIEDLWESLVVAESCFTTDTMNFITQHFGVEFNCPLEVEFEFGLTWGGLMGWDFTRSQFDAHLARMTE